MSAGRPDVAPDPGRGDEDMTTLIGRFRNDIQETDRKENEVYTQKMKLDS